MNIYRYVVMFLLYQLLLNRISAVAVDFTAQFQAQQTNELITQYPTDQYTGSPWSEIGFDIPGKQTTEKQSVVKYWVSSGEDNEFDSLDEPNMSYDVNKTSDSFPLDKFEIIYTEGTVQSPTTTIRASSQPGDENNTEIQNQTSASPESQISVNVSNDQFSLGQSEIIASEETIDLEELVEPSSSVTQIEDQTSTETSIKSEIQLMPDTQFVQTDFVVEIGGLPLDDYEIIHTREDGSSYEDIIDGNFQLQSEEFSTPEKELAHVPFAAQEDSLSLETSSVKEDSIDYMQLEPEIEISFNQIKQEVLTTMLPQPENYVEQATKQNEVDSTPKNEIQGAIKPFSPITEVDEFSWDQYQIIEEGIPRELVVAQPEAENPVEISNPISEVDDVPLDLYEIILQESPRRLSLSQNLDAVPLNEVDTEVDVFYPVPETDLVMLEQQQPNSEDSINGLIQPETEIVREKVAIELFVDVPVEISSPNSEVDDVPLDLYEIILEDSPRYLSLSQTLDAVPLNEVDTEVDVFYPVTESDLVMLEQQSNSSEDMSLIHPQSEIISEDILEELFVPQPKVEIPVEISSPNSEDDDALLEESPRQLFLPQAEDQIPINEVDTEMNLTYLVPETDLVMLEQQQINSEDSLTLLIQPETEIIREEIPRELFVAQPEIDIPIKISSPISEVDDLPLDLYEIILQESPRQLFCPQAEDQTPLNEVDTESDLFYPVPEIDLVMLDEQANSSEDFSKGLIQPETGINREEIVRELVVPRSQGDIPVKISSPISEVDDLPLDLYEIILEESPRYLSLPRAENEIPLHEVNTEFDLFYPVVESDLVMLEQQQNNSDDSNKGLILPDTEDELSFDEFDSELQFKLTPENQIKVDFDLDELDTEVDAFPLKQYEIIYGIDNKSQQQINFQAALITPNTKPPTPELELILPTPRSEIIDDFEELLPELEQFSLDLYERTSTDQKEETVYVENPQYEEFTDELDENLTIIFKDWPLTESESDFQKVQQIVPELNQPILEDEFAASVRSEDDFALDLYEIIYTAEDESTQQPMQTPESQENIDAYIDDALDQIYAVPNNDFSVQLLELENLSPEEEDFPLDQYEIIFTIENNLTTPANFGSGSSYFAVEKFPSPGSIVSPKLNDFQQLPQGEAFNQYIWDLSQLDKVDLKLMDTGRISPVVETLPLTFGTQAVDKSTLISDIGLGGKLEEFISFSPLSEPQADILLVDVENNLTLFGKDPFPTFYSPKGVLSQPDSFILLDEPQPEIQLIGTADNLTLFGKDPFPTFYSPKGILLQPDLDNDELDTMSTPMEEPAQENNVVRNTTAFGKDPFPTLYTPKGQVLSAEPKQKFEHTPISEGILKEPFPTLYAPKGKFASTEPIQEIENETGFDADVVDAFSPVYSPKGLQEFEITPAFEAASKEPFPTLYVPKGQFENIEPISEIENATDFDADTSVFEAAFKEPFPTLYAPKRQYENIEPISEIENTTDLDADTIDEFSPSMGLQEFGVTPVFEVISKETFSEIQSPKELINRIDDLDAEIDLSSVSPINEITQVFPTSKSLVISRISFDRVGKQGQDAFFSTQQDEEIVEQQIGENVTLSQGTSILQNEQLLEEQSNENATLSQGADISSQGADISFSILQDGQLLEEQVNENATLSQGADNSSSTLSSSILQDEQLAEQQADENATLSQGVDISSSILQDGQKVEEQANENATLSQGVDISSSILQDEQLADEQADISSSTLQNEQLITDQANATLSQGVDISSSILQNEQLTEEQANENATLSQATDISSSNILQNEQLVEQQANEDATLSQGENLSSDILQNEQLIEQQAYENATLFQGTNLSDDILQNEYLVEVSPSPSLSNSPPPSPLNPISPQSLIVQPSPIPFVPLPSLQLLRQPFPPRFSSPLPSTLPVVLSPSPLFDQSSPTLVMSPPSSPTKVVRQRQYKQGGPAEFIDRESICNVSRAGCDCLPFWSYDADGDGTESLFRGCVQTKDARGRAWCPIDPNTCRGTPASEGVSSRERIGTPWDLCPKRCTLTRRGQCKTTSSGCECRLRWTYEGLLQQGCTRPDGTSAFNWCVVRESCKNAVGFMAYSPDNFEWDVCQESC